MDLPKGYSTTEKDELVVDPDVVYPNILRDLMKYAARERKRYDRARKAADATDAPAEARIEPVPNGLEELEKVKEEKDGTFSGLTQYTMEVVYQCAKLDAMIFNKMAGLNEGRSVRQFFRGSEGYKDRWAVANHEKTRDPDMASKKGKEARIHYQRMRGVMPQ